MFREKHRLSKLILKLIVKMRQRYDGRQAFYQEYLFIISKIIKTKNILRTLIFVRKFFRKIIIFARFNFREAT